jgi:hypothetical protein
MSTTPPIHADLTDLQTEMRRILPRREPKIGKTFKDLRGKNQEAFDHAMRLRQRPTRVS